MIIGDEEFVKLLKKSKLSIDDKSGVKSDISRIISWIEEIRSVNTDDIEPLINPVCESISFELTLNDINEKSKENETRDIKSSTKINQDSYFKAPLKVV